jgi:hypothetical protein
MLLIPESHLFGHKVDEGKVGVDLIPNETLHLLVSSTCW